METQKLLDELEEIKTRLINLELLLIKSEKASKKDIKRVKMALKEYKEGKTIPLPTVFLNSFILHLNYFLELKIK